MLSQPHKDQDGEVIWSKIFWHDFMGKFWGRLLENVLIFY